MTLSRRWEDLAHTLAARMKHHARCESHTRSEADPECPFCEDRAAYDAYLDKVNETARRIR